MDRTAEQVDTLADGLALVVLRAFGLRLAKLERELETRAVDRERRKRRPPKAKRPRCLARCRSRGGRPCQAPVVVDRDGDGRIRVRCRCLRHGGRSTGAKTAEGRARLRDAGRRGAVERWRRWREARNAAGRIVVNTETSISVLSDH